PAVVVVTLAGYGILLALADWYGKRRRNISDVRLRDALVIGFAQALSLVPGTSRSGVTISAGLMLGFQRRDAARFSFLLSAPVILLATAYEVALLISDGGGVAWSTLAVAALISCLVAYASIEFFMRFVSAIGLLPFAIYRLLLAAAIAVLLL
ncbi:MAG: undecaprenyl-diphosphate phosphatase, partial [Woeseiaceae bacterium]